MPVFKCPNCGSSSHQRISDTELKCIHCDTVFYEDTQAQVKKAVKAEREKNREAGRDAAMARAYEQVKKTRRTILVVMLVIMLAGIGAGVYLSMHAMDKAEKQQQGMEKEIKGTIQHSQP